MKRQLSPAMIALVALLIALTTIFTLVVRIPVPATQGYVNLSDVVITFAGLVFGPWVGLAAGGVGTALADVVGGYAQFAWLSLLAHGLEGLLIGLVSRQIRSRGFWGDRKQLEAADTWPTAATRAVPRMVLAWLPGALAMVAAYLVGEGVLLTGWPAAIAEVPFNTLQVLVGVVLGVPLVLAVRRAYPPVDRIGRPRKWTE